MTTDDAVVSVFGWCQTHGRPDQYHAICRVTYRTPFGVEHRCGCPGHDAESPSVDRDSSVEGGRIGTENGPESALTDRGQRPHPAKEL